MQSHVDTDALLRDISARLDPNRILVDDRNLRDRLAFIASLAELIVFYDEHNQPAGNWRAFVLKDPVILLAVISKTSYQQLDAHFSRIQPSFHLIRQQMSQPEGVGASASPDWPERVRNTVCQLLSLLDKMFESLEGWMTVMSAGEKDYHLRQFLEQKIRHSLAPALSQRVAAQNYLAATMKSCVTPMAAQAFRHWLPLWKSSAGINTQFGSVPEAMDLLEQLYQQVFSCYVQVITSARQAFEQLSEQPCDFPDTALLMAFHRLLMFSQQGLNQYSQQHLQFYYRDILHQQARGVLPDRAYLCLTLAPGHTSLTLPAGTRFTGGRYADNTPILFASIRPCEVNTAQLGQLFSSSYRLVGDELPSNETQQHDSVSRRQYLEQLPDTRKIRHDSTQQVLACDWFGGQPTQTVQQGFVLASPMLVLKSGIRVLTITFSLDQPVNAESWQGATSWFSGKKGWFQASDVRWTQGETGHQLRLTITLQSDEPAVEAFSQPPGGYEAILPYCRMMLPESLDLRAVPRLLTLDMQVSVTQSDSFSLLSDNGPLVPGKPMPILGAIPEVGSHCYIRDAEIVDKPLTQLDLTLSWENIPADFSVYFSAYNAFLYHQGGAKQTWCNTAFRIAWQVYTANGWQPASAQISAVSDNDEATDAQPSSPNRHWWQRLWHRQPSPPQPIVQQHDGLFAQQWGRHKRKTVAENALGTHYQFSFSEPQRCLESLLTGQPQLRMTLIAPADGFGHAIYAQLVSATSLENAKVLMNGAGLLGPVVKILRGLGHLVGMKSLGKVQPLPPLPWGVKAQQATLSYQATQSFDFTDPAAPADKEQGHGTLTLLHIGALATYPYFCCQSGQAHPSLDLRHVRLQPVPSPERTSQGLALYSGVSRPANSLYIQLTDVVRPCRVNLLIELAQDLSRESQSREPQRSEVSLYYWGTMVGRRCRSCWIKPVD
ncbi:hypothetical protein [Vibrio spartinae]|uniref:Baseplate protein J-like domain-containing protein n=1 Tax=Vibrio spartinae TaxID=1918945 RepID=A0ABX6R4E7_9VIBR|nr:hypothetical protein [Vibrio spartinae]QMV15965.1 hypothetical protein Vspart_03339 [Vibrio spartinae]